MLDFITEKVKFKLDGVPYEFNVPNVEQNRNFTQKYNPVKDDAVKVIELVYDYLEELGLSKDVSKKLNQNQLDKLLLSFSDSKKK